MAVLRQENWLGQQRVDVSHLRSVESASCADFDLAEGQIIAGGVSLVVKGFVIVTSGAVGAPAINLQLVTANGIILHQLASQSGTMYQTPANRPVEVLNTLNPNVVGSFSTNSTNYVGLDLTRNADPSTADLVEFLNADTELENPETVPLARTLNYTVIISTSDFTTQPNVLPIAIVVTDVNNNVVTLTDARQLAWRLGTGSTVPNPGFAYSWPYGRAENLTGDVFVGGDKGIASLKEWGQAIMTRLQELGGGPYWYSPSMDRQVKFCRNLLARFATGDNFSWDGTNLTWTGLSFVFSNSPFLDGSGNPIFDNFILDQPTALSGLTNMAIGDCIYVDIDQTTQRQGTTALSGPPQYPYTGDALYGTGGNALIPVKAPMASLGTSLTSGARWVLAWRGADGLVQTRDSMWTVGTMYAPASTSANGVVELNTAVATALTATPPVVVADMSAYMHIADAGAAIATGLSRGEVTGTAPAISAGALAIGYGQNDTSIVVGDFNGNVTSQLISIGAGGSTGSTVTNIDANTVNIGVNNTYHGGIINVGTANQTTTVAIGNQATNTAISIQGGVASGGSVAIEAYNVNIGGFFHPILTATTASTSITATGNIAINTTTGTISIGTTTNANITIGDISATSGTTTIEGHAVQIQPVAALNLYGGTGGATLDAFGSAISIGPSGATSIVIGNTGNTTPITLETGGQTINIGNESSADTINIGSSTAASLVNLQTITGGTISVGVSSTNAHVQVGSSGTSAQTSLNGGNGSLFVIQNSAILSFSSVNVIELSNTSINLKHPVTFTNAIANINGYGSAGSLGASLVVARSSGVPLSYNPGSGGNVFATYKVVYMSSGSTTAITGNPTVTLDGVLYNSSAQTGNTTAITLPLIASTTLGGDYYSTWSISIPVMLASGFNFTATVSAGSVTGTGATENWQHSLVLDG